MLTAARGDLGLARVTVSVDERIDTPATLHAGTCFASPACSPRQNDPQDLAVVLDAPVADITPTPLPAAGAAAALSHGQPFTVVGNGGQERTVATSGWTIRDEIRVNVPWHRRGR